MSIVFVVPDEFEGFCSWIKWIIEFESFSHEVTGGWTNRWRRRSQEILIYLRLWVVWWMSVTPGFMDLELKAVWAQLDEETLDWWEHILCKQIANHFLMYSCFLITKQNHKCVLLKREHHYFSVLQQNNSSSIFIFRFYISILRGEGLAG